MSAPVYIQKFDAAALPGQRAVATQSNEASNQAIARFGQALSGTAQVASQASAVFDHVNRSTAKLQVEADSIEQSNALVEKYRNDPDPATAADRAKEEAWQKANTQIARLSPADQQEYKTFYTQKIEQTAGRIRQLSLGRQQDQTQANLNTLATDAQKRYVEAGSPDEQQRILADFGKSLEQNTRLGLIGATQAQAYLKSFTASGDEALVLRDMAKSPDAALANFNDPTKYAGLDPTTRERYKAQAQTARDELTRQRLQQQERMVPGSGMATIGRINTPEQLRTVIERAIIPQESGGNPNAVSVQNARGVGQIMPSTARLFGAKVGRPDLATMPQGELEQLLNKDVRLNKEIAFAHLKEGAEMSEGSLYAAIAGYHGGNGWAASIHKQAVARHGQNYSAAQFAALIPPTKQDETGKKTSDYLIDVVRRMGGDPNGTGMREGAQWVAQNAVASEWQTSQALTNRTHQQEIQGAFRQAEDQTGVLNQGFAVDPLRVANTRRTLMMAEAAGDANAAIKRRELDEAVEVRPIIAEAKTMLPEALGGAIGQMRQAVAASPDVSPAMLKRLKLFEGVHSEMLRLRSEDPISLGVGAGVVPATSVPPPNQITSPEAGAALARRSVAMDRVTGIYGAEPKFFRPDEAKSYKAAYEQADDTAKIDMLSALAKGASPQAYAAAVKQIAGDSPVLQWAGTLARTDVETARSILRGQQLLNDKGTPDPKATELRNALKGTLRGDLFPGEHQGAVIEAALAIYAAERGKSWTLYDGDDRAGLEKALQRAAGGVITRHNGGQTVLPRGMGEAQFSTVWNALDNQALAGAHGGNGLLSPDFIKRTGQLVRVSPDDGKYLVVIPQGGQQRPVTGPMGEPFILDMDRLGSDPRYQFGNMATGEGLRSLDARNRQMRQRFLEERDRVRGMTP
jgi:hypothetical protein